MQAHSVFINAEFERPARKRNTTGIFIRKAFIEKTGKQKKDIFLSGDRSASLRAHRKVINMNAKIPTDRKVASFGVLIIVWKIH